MFKIVLVGLEANMNGTIRDEQRLRIAWTMNQSDSVTPQNNEWFLGNWTGSGVLHLDRQFTAISRYLVTQESLGQFPVASLGVRFGIGKESIGIEVETFTDQSLFNVSQSDTIRMAVEDELVLCAIPVGGLTLVGDSEAETMETTFGLAWTVVFTGSA